MQRTATMFGALVLAMSAGALADDRNDRFTDDFPIEDCRFSSTGGNAFFILRPGRQLVYDNDACVAAGECEDFERLQITVLNRTRDVVLVDDGVRRTITTRVVEEREWENGRLHEVSRNFFAACGNGPMRDVYYFGEDVDEYEYVGGKVIVTHPGQWLAGRNGAEPGLIMPGGAFLLGARYYQEVAPGVALDRARHVAIDFEFRTGAGKFDDCVKVLETTPLEPDSESSKIYCPRVGLVQDDELVLQMILDPGA
jgi:hypothetical protein